MKNSNDSTTKQTVRQVISNNAFLFKLCFTASPIYFICIILDAIRHQISIFFEHIIGIGYVLDAAQYHYPFHEVIKYISILTVGIALGMVFTVFVGNFIETRELPKVRLKIRMALYEKAQTLDLECYDNPEYYNELVLAVSEADKQIDRCVKLLRDTTMGITVFISTGIYFLLKDKCSVIFVIVSFVLSFLFQLLYNKLSYQLRIKRNPFERKREYIKRVFYLGDYAKEIRLNPEIESVLFEDFETCNKEIYHIEKSYAVKRFWLGFLSNYVSNDFICSVLYIGYLIFRSAVEHVLSFGSVIILFNSFGNLRESLRLFTDVYPYASETSLYVQKIRNFLEYEPKIISKKKLPVSDDAKSITLNHVTFQYNENSKNVINDISLSIHPGEKIALVGYNGAGKTTLIKLIMRLYDTTNGEIILNGVNIKDYDVWSYRNAIGTVFQDYKIFAASVLENVLLSTVDHYEPDKVKDSLTRSGLSNRVDHLKNGLSTQLTSEFDKDGVNLSGGESQKLAIARVFYKDAGLIILDEPSSALDPIAEYQLNHTMLQATENKTVIFISHRLSTTRLADRIVLLEHGHIAEQGTHDQLLKQKGKYAEMWRAQAGQYIDVS